MHCLTDMVKDQFHPIKLEEYCSQLERVNCWFTGTLAANLACILGDPAYRRSISESIRRFISRYYLEVIVGPIILDIIIDYPESKPICNDIKVVVRRRV